MSECIFCHCQGARKVRVDLFPWMRKCVQVCVLCMKDLPVHLQELRDAIEATWVDKP